MRISHFGRGLRKLCSPRVSNHNLALALGLCGFAISVLLAVSYRFSLDPDGLSYLEVGEAWLSGDFTHAINGYWSPLYPILVALSSQLSGDGVYEVVGPHLLSVGIFVSAFLAFRSFSNEVIARIAVEGPKADIERFVICTGYPFFIWCAAFLIHPGELHPDLLVLLFVVCASTAMLRSDQGDFAASISFGLCLGLAYLTKPVMFPLSLIWLAGYLLWAVLRPVPMNRRFIACAPLMFLLIASLYVIPLSVKKGRFTFSDSGVLAYAWEVNRVSPYFHWQGKPDGTGTPVRPTSQILDAPPTFAFDSHLPGTYTLWFDASVWNEGLRPRFRLSQQATRILSSLRFLRDFLLRNPIHVVILFSILMMAKCSGCGRTMANWRTFTPLFFVSAAAFALYSLVYIAPRYLAPFALISVTPALATLAFVGRSHRDVLNSLRTVIASFSVILPAVSTAGSAGADLPIQRDYRVHKKVADYLSTDGLSAGDGIAIIGDGSQAFFARLLRLRIISETLVRDDHPKWEPTANSFAAILESVRNRTRARAVVSSIPPPPESAEWHKVPATGYWITLLDR